MCGLGVREFCGSRGYMNIGIPLCTPILFDGRCCVIVPFQIDILIRNELFADCGCVFLGQIFLCGPPPNSGVDGSRALAVFCGNRGTCDVHVGVFHQPYYEVGGRVTDDIVDMTMFLLDLESLRSRGGELSTIPLHEF